MPRKYRLNVDDSQDDLTKEGQNVHRIVHETADCWTNRWTFRGVFAKSSSENVQQALIGGFYRAKDFFLIRRGDSLSPLPVTMGA
jgi:hypothetical protein